MSSIAFQTIEGRVAFVKEINFSQSLKLFLVLLRMYKIITTQTESVCIWFSMHMIDIPQVHSAAFYLRVKCGLSAATPDRQQE